MSRFGLARFFTDDKRMGDHSIPFYLFLFSFRHFFPFDFYRIGRLRASFSLLVYWSPCNTKLTTCSMPLCMGYVKNRFVSGQGERISFLPARAFTDQTVLIFRSKMWNGTRTGIRSDGLTFPGSFSKSICLRSGWKACEKVSKVRTKLKPVAINAWNRFRGGKLKWGRKRNYQIWQPWRKERN